MQRPLITLCRYAGLFALSLSLATPAFAAQYTYRIPLRGMRAAVAPATAALDTLSGPPNTAFTVTFSGTNLVQGMTMTVAGTNYAVTTNSATLASAVFPAAGVGSYPVTLKTPQSQSIEVGTMAIAYATVTASVSPTTGVENTAFAIDFSGSNFVADMTMTVNGTNYPVTTASADTASATFPALPGGSYPVLLNTPDAGQQVNTGTVTVGPEQISLTIAADSTNYNIFSAAGSPNTAKALTVTVNSGVSVYSTNTALPGLTTGSGWALGSTIRIVNNGTIAGAGGSTAAKGGDALSLSWPVALDNTNGYLYGGGGGGGKGGNGGAGGTGGQGASSSFSFIYTQSVSYVLYDPYDDTWSGVFNGASVAYGVGFPPAAFGAYQTGSYQDGRVHPADPYLYYEFYEIGYTTTTTTAGGGGGAGGTGGNGGRGKGVDAPSATGVAGLAGAAGSAGGANAGAGGAGGTGGLGGAGGDWGSAGQAGSTGTAGATGTAGNSTAGSAGAAGQAGTSAGPAGKAVVAGGHAVTWLGGNDATHVKGAVN
jgi:hypothetical protein